MKGSKLSSIDNGKAYQTSLKTICLDFGTIRNDDAEYYDKHGGKGTTVFQNGRYLVCFKQITGDLINGEKQRRGILNKFDQTNKIGSKKWLVLFCFLTNFYPNFLLNINCNQKLFHNLHFS